MATRTIDPGTTVVAPAEAYRLTAPPGTRIDLVEVPLASLEAGVASLSRSAVARLVARRAEFRFSAVAAAAVRTLDASWSSIGAALAAKVEAKTLVAQWLVGGVVTADTVYAVAVLSPRVSGNVRAILGFNGALGLGLAMVIGSVAHRWVRGRTHRP